MKEFGYTFEELDRMTETQIYFLITGLQVDAKEKSAAQRRKKLARRG